jgi:hypothetical protein
MPYKDPIKRRECRRRWALKHPEYFNEYYHRVIKPSGKRLIYARKYYHEVLKLSPEFMKISRLRRRLYRISNRDRINIASNRWYYKDKEDKRKGVYFPAEKEK